MRLLLADDHELLRDTLEHYLLDESDFEVVSVADLDAALARLREGARFDLILLDVNMPGMNGLEGLQRVQQLVQDQPVALISGTAPRAVVVEALRMGAVGFLPKSMPARSLANAIRFIGLGERFVPVDMVFPAADADFGAPQSACLRDMLTEREVDVLLGLCRGQSNKEIARALGLGEATVKLHVKTLYRRLGVNNRTQAALIGRKAGLV